MKREDLPIDPDQLPPPGELLDGELDMVASALAEPEVQPMLQATLSPLRVAFQGEAGAFSEEAIVQLWGAEAEPVPMRTFADVMDAAETGSVEYGLLPIESTLMGGVDSAYDLLAMHDGLLIAAETIVPIRLCVLGVPGSTLADLTQLHSHPLMLAQCAHFLERYKHITPVPAWDTAGAARAVMQAGDPTRAAAGSRRAADRFGLELLADGIEDRPDTQMRFLAVARTPAPLESGAPARSAALCTVRDVAGGLIAALQPLAKGGFNVTHFVARPTREPWQYMYYIEFEHEAADPDAANALEAVRKAAMTYRLLGTFPRWASGNAQPGGDSLLT
ncbi:MAG: prephenate dehydratase domain-containing protein [Gemmatimonadota bacterium]